MFQSLFTVPHAEINIKSVMRTVGPKVVENHSRLAELDQVLVCGPGMEATDIQVGFTQLFPSPAAAVAATVGVGTGGCHLVAGGHIGLLR